MVQLRAQCLYALAHLAQIHHHAAVRVRAARNTDFRVVSVAVHAQAALGLYLAAQGMRGIEKKPLADAKVLC